MAHTHEQIHNQAYKDTQQARIICCFATFCDAFLALCYGITHSLEKFRRRDSPAEWQLAVARKAKHTYAERKHCKEGSQEGKCSMRIIQKLIFSIRKQVGKLTPARGAGRGVVLFHTDCDRTKGQMLSFP